MIITKTKKLIQFNKISSPDFSFANVKKKQLFICFIFVEKCKLWMHLTSHLNRHLNLPHLTPQSAIFGFLYISNKDYLIVNHFLLLFKY